jgi:hypothetical protein
VDIRAVLSTLQPVDEVSEGDVAHPQEDRVHGRFGKIDREERGMVSTHCGDDSAVEFLDLPEHLQGRRYITGIGRHSYHGGRNFRSRSWRFLSILMSRI